MTARQATHFIGRTQSAIAIVITLGLSGCGGSDALISGTLSGLGDGLTVVLQNNSTDNLSLTMNGGFTFQTSVADGATYSVTVLTQPTGQTCNVSNGTGTVNPDKGGPSDIAVTCSATSSLGGTVTGMLAGRSVTLANGVQQISVAQNGLFAFPGVLPAGSTYTVTIVEQPAGQLCTVVNATGTVVPNVMATVAVTCS